MTDAASAVVVAAIEGLTLTLDEERFYREQMPAGVTLFRRNIPQSDYTQTLALTQKLQNLRPSGSPPFIVAIDQEGGRVSRTGAPFPNLGPALHIADGRIDTASLDLLHKYGYDVGRSLGAMGVNVDFAPVLDVLTNPGNTAIGDRVFGTTVDQVISRAKAFLGGLQSTPVRGCLKHFPGQGDASVDTHLGTAAISVSLQTLWARELAPFRALIHEAPMVMISHCIYPVLCDREASRSPVVIGDWLRGRLGFTGVVVSDDMNMGALPQEIRDWQDALISAIAAGCDILLVCRYLDRCYAALEALRREAARSPAFYVRLHDAAERVTRMRSNLSS